METHRSSCLLASTAAAGGLVLALAAPGVADAAEPAGVRFLHAVPGAGAAALALDGSSDAIAKSGFGDLTAYAPAASGRQTLELAAKPGADPMASLAATLKPGAHYTVLAVPVGEKVRLKLLRDGGARAGEARLRLVHAAPELGSPDLWLGSKELGAAVPFEAVTGYLKVPARTATFAVAQRGQSATPLVAKKLSLPAGQSETAFVIGSRGRKLHIITAQDGKASRAQATGVSGSKASTVAGGSAYTVRAGDSLWSITRAALGPRASNAAVATALRKMWNRNASRIASGDPDMIQPGQKLTLN